MLNDLWQLLGSALGLQAETLTAWQMGLRALVVYVLGLAIVRIGEKRFIGKFSAFDVILGFMLGSTLAGAISGSSPFFPSLFAAVCLVGIHFVFARLSFRSNWFGSLVKGHSRILITDGEINWDEMRRGNISEKDLLSALRENGRVGSPSDVKEARLERSGNISVIRRDG